MMGKKTGEKLVASLTFHDLENTNACVRRQLLTWLDDAKETVRLDYERVAKRCTKRFTLPAFSLDKDAGVKL